MIYDWIDKIAQDIKYQKHIYNKKEYALFRNLSKDAAQRDMMTLQVARSQQNQIPAYTPLLHKI